MDYDSIGITSAIIDSLTNIMYVINPFVNILSHKLIVNWNHQKASGISLQKVENMRNHLGYHSKILIIIETDLNFTPKYWKHKKLPWISLENIEKTRNCLISQSLIRATLLWHYLLSNSKSKLRMHHALYFCIFGIQCVGISLRYCGVNF